MVDSIARRAHRFHHQRLRVMVVDVLQEHIVRWDRSHRFRVPAGSIVAASVSRHHLGTVQLDIIV